MFAVSTTPAVAWDTYGAQGHGPVLSEAHGHTECSGHLETRCVNEALTLEAGSGWHRCVSIWKINHFLAV